MSWYTPGPWNWVKGDKYDVHRLAPGILLSVGADGTPWGDEIDRANARLIAAAPTMFDYIQKKANDGCAEAALILEKTNAS